MVLQHTDRSLVSQYQGLEFNPKQERHPESGTSNSHQPPHLYMRYEHIKYKDLANTK